MKMNATEIIRARTDRVFEVFTDIANAAGRIKGISKVEILGDIRSGRGLRWRETRTMFGKEATEEMEITAFDPLRSYVVEAKSHGMHYLTRFTFEPADGGSATRVTWVFEGTPITFTAKLMTPLMFLFKGASEKMMKQDMLDLKKHLEA